MKNGSYQWSNDGRLSSCITCSPLSKPAPSSNVITDCYHNTRWRNSVCSYRCAQSNHYLFGGDKMNKSDLKFVCKCPYNRNNKQRDCSWTSNKKSKRSKISPDPAKFKCNKPNFKLKCNLREKETVKISN